MPVLEADSIELQYGSRPVLRGVYLRVAVGEVVGLLGRNGCGKSSLLRIVAGHQGAENQSVRLDRQYLAPTQRAEQIRYLPQHPLTPGGMRVARAFGFYEADYARFRQYFPETRVSPQARFADLSGGERRLVETGLVLLSPVPFVLLDEPFSHVAPLQIERLQELIRDESARKGILLSDHLYRHLLDGCDRLYFLSQGGRTQALDGDPRERLADLGYLAG
jgi:ABC-type multidrug transport system ATPase subunit